MHWTVQVGLTISEFRVQYLGMIFQVLYLRLGSVLGFRFSGVTSFVGTLIIPFSSPFILSTLWAPLFVDKSQIPSATPSTVIGGLLDSKDIPEIAGTKLARQQEAAECQTLKASFSRRLRFRAPGLVFWMCRPIQVFSQQMGEGL